MGAEVKIASLYTYRHTVYIGRQESTFNNENYNEHFNYNNFQFISYFIGRLRSADSYT